MTSLQLVRGEHYEVVPNPLEDSPDAFSRDDMEPVLLGSQDLVKIAILLRAVSLVPTRLSLVDRTFTPVGDDSYEDEQTQLLAHIRASDERQITQYMWDHLSGIYIAGVDFMYRDRPLARISVRQKGVLNASDPEVGASFANFLNSAGFNE